MSDVIYTWMNAGTLLTLDNDLFYG